ncbi:protein FAM43B-like [Anguilla anguilla]|uniref:protein FAM43B-like n=1 Tax=Anguilla anguilla TaxID=7936 RepID=UPI0015ACDC12|nr:protein FAM43B-like [Anguilla anguilla]
MLPWRRRKIVLVEEETKAKPKSLGVGTGGAYGSVVWSLVRSFPDLLPEWPLKRLGRAFRSKRQTVELNRDDPVYTVRYLGSAVTLSGKGEGCTEEAVGKIWSRSDYGGKGARMKLAVGPQGVRLGASGDRRKPCHLFYLHRVTCCAADARRPKIFAWVYRHQVKNKAVVLRCHAVLVARAEKARALALSLSQAAAAAFGEFKRLKRQSDLRHVRQQLLGEGVAPLTPIRRLLNGQCRYQPAADRHPAARLCAIAEEEEEEEEEEVVEEERGERGKQPLPDGYTAAEDTASLRGDGTDSSGPSAAG